MLVHRAPVKKKTISNEEYGRACHRSIKT